MNYYAKTLDFRKGGTQVVEYAGSVHTIVYAGQCVVCRTRVYDGLNSSYLEHDNCALVASEYGKQGPDVPLCFNCSNDEPRYTRGLAYANRRKWKDVPQISALVAA